MADDVLSPEERDACAAELALGVLAGEERAHALRLQLADAGFRAEVEAWEGRLAPLVLAAPEVAPPAGLWPLIAARLPEAASGGEGTVQPIGKRLAAWRIGALTSGAIAAGLALVLVFGPLSQPPLPTETPAAQQQAIVAQLGTEASGAQLIASYDPATAELRIRAVELPESELSTELWVIPAGGAPLSLGLVSAQDGATVAVPEALRAQLREGAMLAVSLEPAEGAPHAAPSSTPIAVGTLRQL